MDSILRFIALIIVALFLQILTVVYLGVIARHLKEIKDQLFSLKEMLKYKK